MRATIRAWLIRHRRLPDLLLILAILLFFRIFAPFSTCTRYTFAYPESFHISEIVILSSGKDRLPVDMIAVRKKLLPGEIPQESDNSGEPDVLNQLVIIYGQHHLCLYKLADEYILYPNMPACDSTINGCDFYYRIYLPEKTQDIIDLYREFVEARDK